MGHRQVAGSSVSATGRCNARCRPPSSVARRRVAPLHETVRRGGLRRATTQPRTPCLSREIMTRVAAVASSPCDSTCERRPGCGVSGTRHEPLYSALPPTQIGCEPALYPVTRDGAPRRLRRTTTDPRLPRVRQRITSPVAGGATFPRTLNCDLWSVFCASGTRCRAPLYALPATRRGAKRREAEVASRDESPPVRAS